MVELEFQVFVNNQSFLLLVDLHFPLKLFCMYPFVVYGEVVDLLCLLWCLNSLELYYLS